MPRVTRWLVRTALLWLVVGLLLLSLHAVPPLRTSWPWLSAAGPASLHLLTVGWLTQVVFGVAGWLFPRRPGGDGPRHVALAWTTYLALNSGLVLRLIFEPLAALEPLAIWHVALPPSAALQWISACAFVALAWGRVRGK